MAGGTFDKSVGKIRPGTYINFESANQQLLGTSDRGTITPTVILLVTSKYSSIFINQREKRKYIAHLTH